ncbi:MAG: Na/Pi symporter, partial [Bacteroidota bacterium]
LGLFIGILATAIVQSSSTTTSIVVTLVAVENLGIELAVPLILGANIGTAVTSTIVALGYIGNREEFQKAVAGASVHDMFNILVAVILFILEMSTKAISNLANQIVSIIPTTSGDVAGSILSPLKILSTSIQNLFGDNPYITLFIGLALLFGSIRILTWMLRLIVIGRIKQNLNRYVFEKTYNSFFAGIGTTLILQSSSVTTSLIVPFVATGRVRLKHAFPFIMGANIGTTTTALLAALFATQNTQVAISVALVHILFNLIGVLIFLPFPLIRRIPIKAAEFIGNLAKINRLYGVVYVMLVFFILPLVFIFLTNT